MMQTPGPGLPSKAPPDKNVNRKRPFRVTLLALGVLTIALNYWTRFIASLRSWDFQTSVLPFSPFYLAITGLLWGMIELALVWALWQGWHRTRLATIGSAALYLAYIWAERLLLHPQTQNNSFAAVTSLVFFVIVFWAVSSRKSRAFFGEPDGFEPKDSTTA